MPACKKSYSQIHSRRNMYLLEYVEAMNGFIAYTSRVNKKLGIARERKKAVQPVARKCCHGSDTCVCRALRYSYPRKLKHADVLWVHFMPINDKTLTLLCDEFLSTNQRFEETILKELKPEANDTRKGISDLRESLPFSQGITDDLREGVEFFGTEDQHLQLMMEAPGKISEKSFSIT